MKKIIIFICRFFFSIFYNRKYLSGEWFDNSLEGWKWCWRSFFFQKILRINSHIPFPVHPSITIGNIDNISFSTDNIDNFWKAGSYYQSWHGRIIIGRGTWIAQNVGIITENHDSNDLKRHLPARDVSIGENCWIGMNSVLLPGVTLGNNTIVGAGSIVTHSFPEGNCIIVGNPAKLLRKI